jgi:hypothetical protein
MLLRKRTPPTGICFAWTPKWTPDGAVWLEWVHYKFDEHGLGGISYTRWVPEAQYDKCENETWKQERARLHRWARGGGDALRYATPPDIEKCRNLNPDGATACWYPYCSCMNVGGTKCPG